MIAWLTDTLIMTGAIMALILLVRRPVGHWFGPGAAYALWALPMIRLLLPPLVLPKSVSVVQLAEPAAPSAQFAVGPTLVDVPAGPLVTHVPTLYDRLLDLPWGTILVTIWLGGAAVFLLHRVIAYRFMRRELLRDVRRIGHSGAVRIIESAKVDAPVAFGVFDRVVALPRGFLATADSDASDFAITHELEHHAGNDLIANMAVQPLFALHWFNPLAWLAWRALRSDQEAACDARVMSGRSRRDRERYGRLIASFAAGSRFALAAPMAGPITGDKPIIHRLKALVRNEVPERHLLLGRSLFAASMIAVPLTASVSYAANESVETPAMPLPAAPAKIGAPRAVASPVPDTARRETSWDERLSDANRSGEWEQQHTQAPLHHERIEPIETSASIEQARAMAEQARAQGEVARAEGEAAGAQVEAARAQGEAERRASDAMARAPHVEESTSSDGKVQTVRIVTPGAPGRPAMVRTMVIDANCPADRQSRARAVANGAVAETRICTGVPDSARHVAVALRQARASVAANPRLSAETRREILSEMDQDIAEAQSEND